MFQVITAWLYAGVGEPVTSLRNTMHSFHSCAFQQGLRESTARCRSLEEQLLSLRLSEGEKDCQLKELECSKRALDQEIQSLKLQICSSPTVQTTTDELSSRYVEMINNLREDKDREIRSLRVCWLIWHMCTCHLLWREVSGYFLIKQRSIRYFLGIFWFYNYFIQR